MSRGKAASCYRSHTTIPTFPPSATADDRHAAIARRIRRLGSGCSRNPVETFILERESVAREVELLGDELAEGAR